MASLILTFILSDIVQSKLYERRGAYQLEGLHEGWYGDWKEAEFCEYDQYAID